MELNRKDLARVIAKKCDYTIASVEEMLKAQEDAIEELLAQATAEDNIDIKIARGLIIGSKYYPERAAKDPRNQNDIIVPEKVIPYAKFSYTLKQKINE